MSKISQRKNKLLAFITSQQQLNGGFLSQTTDSAGKFLPTHVTSHTSSTLFATTLILNALSNQKGCLKVRSIAKKAICFLLKEKNHDWSWNYWQKDSNDYHRKAYPNDLDDTFSALTAIQAYEPHLITGEVLAYVIKLLIKSEVSAGGPYNTWLVEKPHALVWNDVDSIVNSTIAHFLAHYNIRLQNIYNFIKHQTNQKTVTSKYYNNTLVQQYFLTRSFPELHLLPSSIKLTSSLCKNPLDVALFIILRCKNINIDCSAQGLHNAINELLSLPLDIVCKPYPFYIEKIVSDTNYYNGSQALTAALCCEALTEYELCMTHNNKNMHPTISQRATYRISTKQRSTQDTIYNDILRVLKNKLQSLTPELKKYTEQTLQCIFNSKNQRHVALQPVYFIQGLCQTDQQKIKKILIPLGLANIYGWISYTLEDNIIDCELDSQKYLPVATMCQRELISIYKDILSPKSFLFVSKILDATDEANCWELEHCWFDITKNLHQIVLPHYTVVNHSAGKSFGYAISPLCILLSLGYGPDSEEIKYVLLFFKHYISARQCNDDAHDWLQDLMKGFINPIGCLILKSYLSKKSTSTTHVILNEAYTDVQKVFWEKIFYDVQITITLEISKAKEALKKISCIYNKKYLLSLLLPLEQTLQKAEHEHIQVKEFLSMY